MTLLALSNYLPSDVIKYRGADKSLARPGRKQAPKHVGKARDFNKIEMRAVIKFLFLQDKAPKEIHAVLTETLVRFLPGRAKDLSAPLYCPLHMDLLNGHSKYVQSQNIHRAMQEEGSIFLGVTVIGHCKKRKLTRTCNSELLPRWSCLYLPT